MSFTFKRVGLLVPAVLALAAGCGGSNLVLPSEGVAAKIVVLSGDKQAGVVGATLVSNLVVRVTDSKDRPVQSQQVSFTPADAGSGQAVPPSPTTNADGQVSVQWVLGTVAGTQTMIAKAVGNGAPANLSVILTATASSSVPAKLEKVAGTDGQTATAGTAVAPAPAVKVTDAQGNPVAGVGVTFAVATGGGSVIPTTPVATDANGVAAVTSWTLGAVAGPNTLTATAAGTGITGNPATFTATGKVGVAAKLGFAVAPSTTAASGVPLATQPHVQIQDAAGNAVAEAGVSVSVAISSGGGALSGGPTVVQTDATGLAVFSGLTISGTAGSYTLLFTASGLASATASVTIGAGNPSGSQSSFSFTPTSFVAGDAAGSTVTITARDASGNPIAGAAAAVAVTGTNTVTTPAPTDANGQTTATVTSNEAGVKTVTVTINGVAVTNPSSATLTVLPGPVSAAVSTVAASPTTLIAGNGSSSTITVTVKDALGNPVPGATVSLASATATITQPAGSTNASGVATGSVSYATTGSKFVSATVNGSIALSQTAAITVNQASTSTTISAPGSATAGVGFGVTVTVSPVAPAGGTPGGTVSVSDGVDVCSPNPVTLVSGSGSCTLTLSTTGSRTVTATYSGDANYAVSSKSTTVNVSGTPTTTIVTSTTSGSSVWGQGVAFTATVASGGGTPTGSVSFYDGGGSCPGTTPLATGVALDGSGQASTASITTLSVAVHTIRACYTPSGSFSSSTGTMVQTVSKASTTATIDTVTPSTTVVGQSYSVTVSVSVNAPGAGTPTGSIGVSDGTGGSCTIVLPSTSCSLTSTTAGGKTLVATYGGDGTFNGDAAPGTSHTVNQASTTTAITSDLSASTTTADPVTVNYKVSVASPGAGTPTGSVTVALDGGENCTGSVAGDGTGTCTIPEPINAGARTVTATYGGDANFAGSPSSAVPHTVTP